MGGLEVHHIKPRGRLGHDVMDNLITLCVGCHSKRHGGRGRNDVSNVPTQRHARRASYD
jgi:5-methylcytosine-specific restriction endonuclease McrA